MKLTEPKFLIGIGVAIVGLSSFFALPDIAQKIAAGALAAGGIIWAFKG